MDNTCHFSDLTGSENLKEFWKDEIWPKMFLEKTPNEPYKKTAAIFHL